MGECIVCGKEDAMMRTCSRCNAYICTEHRLPENHNCPSLRESEDDQESGVQWFDEKFQDVDSERIGGDSGSRFDSRTIGVFLVVAVAVASMLYFGVI